MSMCGLVHIEKLVRIEQDVAEIHQAGLRREARRLRQERPAERLHAAAGLLEEARLRLEGPMPRDAVGRPGPFDEEQLILGQRGSGEADLVDEAVPAVDLLAVAAADHE